MTNTIENEFETALQNLATAGEDNLAQASALYGLMVQLQSSYKDRTGQAFSLTAIFAQGDNSKYANLNQKLLQDNAEAGFKHLQTFVRMTSDHPDTESMKDPDLSVKQKAMLIIADLGLSMVDEFSAKVSKEFCLPVASDIRAGQAVKVASNLDMKDIARLLKQGLTP